jgi:hypothetical protein
MEVIMSFENVLKALNEPTTSAHLVANYGSIIADTLEEVLGSGTKAELQKLAGASGQAVREAIRNAPQTLADEILNAEDHSSDLGRAYVLGQLSLLQTVLAHCASHRADDDFIPRLLRGHIGAVANVLHLDDETTTQGLVERTKLTVEQVTAALREMREMGAADFRQWGGRTMNFLTPVATAVLNDERYKGKYEG